MGLEIILKEIKESSEKEIESINSESLENSKKIINSAKEKVNEELKKKIEDTNNQLLKKRQQVISSANLNVKRLLLIKEKELLDMVYQKTIDKINNISKEENESLLLSLIKKYESTGSKIYSNSKSENTIKKISKLKYSGNINCIGGFIIENENGSIKQEYTYDLILKNVYEKSIKHISDILHG